VQNSSAQILAISELKKFSPHSPTKPTNQTFHAETVSVSAWNTWPSP